MHPSRKEGINSKLLWIVINDWIIFQTFPWQCDPEKHVDSQISSLVYSDHPEIPQCILDRLFLLRWAMRDNTLPFTDIVVLPLLYAELLLHLCDVERRDLVSVFFADIGLYFIVCSFLILSIIQNQP